MKGTMTPHHPRIHQGSGLEPYCLLHQLSASRTLRLLNINTIQPRAAPSVGYRPPRTNVCSASLNPWPAKEDRSFWALPPPARGIPFLRQATNVIDYLVQTAFNVVKVVLKISIPYTPICSRGVIALAISSSTFDPH